MPLHVYSPLPAQGGNGRWPDKRGIPYIAPILLKKKKVIKADKSHQE